MAKKSAKKKVAVKPIADDLLDLTVEFDDLQGKIERLNEALNNEGYIDAVGAEYANRLIQQLNAMIDYRDILAVRLALVYRQHRAASVKTPNT